jgi:cobalamin biosynthesis protein CobT
MRELDCDFCGAQAAGAYEVGPEPPDRSPTQRRRLVLCEDCRVTLTDAIEPLRERLATAESDGDSSATTTTDSATSSAAGTDSATEKSDESTGADDSGESDPLSGPDRAARNGASPAASSTESDDTATTDSDDTATTDSDDAAGSSQSDSSETHSEEPPEFRRVMRLLNNRTFPVDRTEFTELATGAYDLDEREVDRIVEYAVERGVLAVESGQLTRG